MKCIHSQCILACNVQHTSFSSIRCAMFSRHSWPVLSAVKVHSIRVLSNKFTHTTYEFLEDTVYRRALLSRNQGILGFCTCRVYIKYFNLKIRKVTTHKCSCRCSCSYAFIHSWFTDTVLTFFEYITYKRSTVHLTLLPMLARKY